MSDKINPGFMGVATIDSQQCRITSCNIAPKQDVLFYTHVIGLNDTVTSGGTKGEQIGTVQPQKIYGRPSVLGIAGSISFPVFDGLQKVFDNIRKGNYFNIDVMYTCGISRSFKDCRLNGFDFSITAGEYANATIDVLAKSMSEGSSSSSYKTASKFLTWDRVNITATGDGLDLRVFQGVNFKVNNSASYIYTGKSSSKIEPYDLRLGTQEVTGSLSAYFGKGHQYITTAATVGDVKIDSDWFSAQMKVMFKSDSVESQVGPVIVTVPFIGVDKVFE